jgi:restriction system protein
MPLPTYEDMMLPILVNASDGKDHTGREAIEAAAAAFQLTPEQRAELLPSGTQPIVENRANWARFYMTRAGLLVAPRRGLHRITERGRQVLEQKPARVDNKILIQFPEFVQFKSTKSSNDSSTIEPVDVSDNTPQESIEFGYQKIRTALESELLAIVKKCSPNFFERLVVDLLVRMGYGGSLQDAGRAIGKSGDGGIDGIIKEDRLGLDVVYIQAKRWDNTVVGRPEIQRFVGALVGVRARKGVFLTTSTFSQDAQHYISTIDSKVVLIDGSELASLMIDHNVGVSTMTTYELKRVDSDYFEE